MRWKQFLERAGCVDLGAVAEIPPRANVLQLQQLLTEALASADFALDCAERQLGLIERGGAALSAPFYIDEAHNFGVRFPHWAPYMGMSPHEHYEWIVSAVVYGGLTIHTYQFEVARDQRRLQPRNTFQGLAGQAGHIYKEGIHNPRNRS